MDTIAYLEARVARLERALHLVAAQRLLGRSTAGTGAVEALEPEAVRAMIGAGTGSGSVTSVGLSLPAVFTVAGSPVTTAGTLTGALATQAPNLVWAGPTSGVAVAPTFRALVEADVPTLPASKVSGVIDTSATAQSKSGNLGLGVTPTQKLDVSGTSRFGGEVWLYNSAAPSNRQHFKLAHAADGTTRIMTLQDDLTTSYQTWFTFNPGAGIDVGGSLDVTGGVNASTNLTASGVVTATGGGAHTLGQAVFDSFGSGSTTEFTITVGGVHSFLQWVGYSSSPEDGKLTLTASAVDCSAGDLIIPTTTTSGGTPSGSTQSGRIVISTDDNKLFVRYGSAWKSASLT